VNDFGLEPLVLHVLMRETREGIEAHCLEFDHVAVATTSEKALTDLIGMLRSQLSLAAEYADPENLFFPAPIEYWQILAQATPVGCMFVEVDADALKAVPAAAHGIKVQEFRAGRGPVEPKAPRQRSGESDFTELPARKGHGRILVRNVPTRKGPRYSLPPCRAHDVVATSMIKAVLRRFGIDAQRFW
jgi:hypothetical protein